jgi:hypothetical protein
MKCILFSFIFIHIVLKSKTELVILLPLQTCFSPVVEESWVGGNFVTDIISCSLWSDMFIFNNCSLPHIFILQTETCSTFIREHKIETGHWSPNSRFWFVHIKTGLTINQVAEIVQFQFNDYGSWYILQGQSI